MVVGISNVLVHCTARTRRPPPYDDDYIKISPSNGKEQRQMEIDVFEEWD